MGKIKRIVTRAGQKAKLKQLQMALKQLERHSVQEYKRGFEMGGLTMKKAIEQAKDELATAHAAEPPTLTKLDGE